MSIEEGLPMSDKDPKKPLHLEEDEQEMDFEFDPENVQDAGESEEATAAQNAAAQTKLNLQHRHASTDALRMEAYGETDLIKRAKMLASVNGIKYVHFKPIKGNELALQALPTSEMNRLAVLDALFDYGSGTVPFPHFDTFRGRMVDHNGEVFTPKTLKLVDLIHAINAAGLENPSSKQVAESYYIWAMQHEHDGLLDTFNASIPEWDGVHRLDHYLIDLLKPFDTPLNRLVGRYFWLSLYNRITSPGCPAPVSLALIGAQGAGKTRFSRIICETLMSDRDATPVPLDWSTRDFNQFLRNITGNSIIANVAEMGGLKKADIERMKDFATRDKDDFHFKFEDTRVKPRQWIIIMDGNNYEGLQRDDTGNRRTYPIFVGQLPDQDGQPAWQEIFSVDYSNFAKDLWKIMAECKAWMEENGMRKYIELVYQVSRGVADFSTDEMKQSRGTLLDNITDTYLMRAMMLVNYEHNERGGWFVPYREIEQCIMNMSRSKPYNKNVARRLMAVGYEQFKSRKERGYLLPYKKVGDNVITDLNTLLALVVYEEGDDFEAEVKRIADLRSRTSPSEGF